VMRRSSSRCRKADAATLHIYFEHNGDYLLMALH